MTFLKNATCWLALRMLMGVWLVAGVSSSALAKDVLLPADTVAADGEARFFLIAIGTSQYKQKFWPDLKWATQDAKRVATAFGKATGRERLVHLFLDKKASRKRILKVMEEVRREAKPRDIVVFYLSGHGTLALNNDGELEQVAVLHATGRKDPLQSGLSHRHVRRWLEGVSASRKLLVFATCHSGVGKSKLSPDLQKLVASNKGTYVPLQDVSEGALILAASAKGEAAREDDKLKGDIYTHYLLEALTLFDRNKDGLVSALEAHDYAKERTYAHTQGRQRPTADAQFIGDADIPLHGKRQRSGLPLLEAYEPELAGFEVQVDKGVKGTLPLAFPLDPEGSRVALFTPGGTQIAHYKVRARPGETLTIGDMLRGPPFSLGVRAGSSDWQSEDMERVTGAASANETEFNVRYHYRQYAIGLTAFLQTATEKSLRSQLDLLTERQGFLLTLRYDHELAIGWQAFGQLGGGTETLRLIFADKVGEYTLEENRRAPLFEVSGGVGYEILGDLWLQSALGFRQAQYDFSDYGALDAARTFIDFGVSYRFGGVASKL